MRQPKHRKVKPFAQVTQRGRCIRGTWTQAVRFQWARACAPNCTLVPWLDLRVIWGQWPWLTSLCIKCGATLRDLISTQRVVNEFFCKITLPEYTKVVFQVCCRKSEKYRKAPRRNASHPHATETTTVHILVSFQPVLQNRDPTLCPVL